MALEGGRGGNWESYSEKTRIFIYSSKITLHQLSSDIFYVLLTLSRTKFEIQGHLTSNTVGQNRGQGGGESSVCLIIYAPAVS